MKLISPEELKELLGYDGIETINGETFESVYDRLRGFDRSLELDFFTLQKLFRLVAEDAREKAR